MADKPQDEPMEAEPRKEEKKKESDSIFSNEKMNEMFATPWVEYTSILTRIPPEDFSYKLPKIVDPKVQELIDKGIELMEADKNEEAIEVFTEAIKLDNKYALITINRAACYARLGNFMDALEDCETTCELRPDWPQAYLRKGTVLLELFRHRHAYAAFTRGFKLEPTNIKLERGQYEALTRLQDRGQKEGWPRPECGPLADKSVQYTLRRDPKTKHLMDDPKFAEIIEEIRKNPSAISKYVGNEDYTVTMCIAVARSCDVNGPDEDYLDLAFPEEAKELEEKYSKIPWNFEYNPIKEVFIPDPPPPRKEEEEDPNPFYDLIRKKNKGRRRPPPYKRDFHQHYGSEEDLFS